jgi:hypothetical protein
VAVQLLSKPRDEPDTEVVGAGVLHGLPGESIHCVTIEYNEFSVQVQSSLKDDHELQCLVEDENVISMNQAVGWIIRWPATDMRLLEIPIEEAAGAVGAAHESKDANAQPQGRATTRAGAKKLKSPMKEITKSPPRKQKTKEDTKKLPRKLAYNDKAEVSFFYNCYAIVMFNAG